LTFRKYCDIIFYMARSLRIEFEGAFYHILARGNERKNIFDNERDKEHFLELLSAVNTRFGAVFHTYVLMDNHYHLVVETPGGGLSRILHSLNTAYTVYFNKKHNRAGHLFQGRYKAILVEEDKYLLALSRYVHLNPVRAGLVTRPEKYFWSSYSAYVKAGNPEPWLRTDLILGQLYADVNTARKRYKEFVFEGINNSIGNPLQEAYRGLILGSSEFIARFTDSLREEQEIPQSKGRRCSLSPEKVIAVIEKELRKYSVSGMYDPLKAIGIYLCKKFLDLSNKEIAEFFGMKHYSAVTQASKRLEERRKADKALDALVQRMEISLSKISRS